MQQSIQQDAYRRFGIRYLYPYQQLVIHNILEARENSQLVILPTGAGKSLCFMLPVERLSGITLIVYPLLSLISDQHRRFKEAGIPVEVLRGGQSRDERSRIFSRLADQPQTAVLTNPEMLSQKSIRNEFSRLHIAHLVIDEAHTVIEWGTSFRPAFLRLKDFIDHTRARIITAFTATASHQTIEEIRKTLFSSGGLHIIHGDIDRPNIFYQVIPTIAKERTVCTLLSRRESMGPVLIFFSRRAGTEHAALHLRIRLGRKDIFAYHGGMDKRSREAIEAWFLSSENGILCATKAFGLGVDKKNIRTVIHHDLSESAGAYLQESGRAGRDGKPAYAALIYAPGELDTVGDPVFLQYITNLESCRRALLNREFSPEHTESCFGCDTCRDICIQHPDGEAELRRLIGSHAQSFTTQTLCEIAWGRLTKHVTSRRLYRTQGFGILASWRKDDITDALECLKTPH
jgi:ATP-dependent DNA helicase RecQ